MFMYGLLYISNKLYDALKSKYESIIKEGIATLSIYFENSVTFSNIYHRSQSCHLPKIIIKFISNQNQANPSI